MVELASGTLNTEVCTQLGDLFVMGLFMSSSKLPEIKQLLGIQQNIIGK